MKLLITLLRLWKSIALDFVIELLLLKDLAIGIVYDLICIITDRFTKYAYMILVLRIQDALTIAQVFLRIIFANYEISNEIILNKNKLFTSKFWKTFIAFLKMKQKMSTAFYSQMNA